METAFSLEEGKLQSLVPEKNFTIRCPGVDPFASIEQPRGGPGPGAAPGLEDTLGTPTGPWLGHEQRPIAISRDAA